MAVFSTSYKITKGNEGGYVNDPRDQGGETYKGISRKNHPKWIGWKIIDDYKKKIGGKIPKNHTIPDAKLDQLVVDFYKVNFWNVIDGDKINNQNIANLIFDFGVNGNHVTVITFVERLLNGLGFKVNVDGKIDPLTLKHINSANQNELYKKLKERIKVYYQNLAKQDPEKYGWALPGWMNRLKKFPDTIAEEIKKKVED